MKEYLRDLAMYCGVLVVALSAFLVYRHYQSDVLDFSLDLIGGKLLAMVPEGADRQKIAALFDTFKERVAEKQVSSAQIENVAANVINLSNSGARLSPVQAASVLNLAILAPAAALAAADSLPPVAALIDSFHIRVPAPPDSTSFKALGKRLKVMIEIDREIQESLAESEHQAGRPHARMHYYFDNKMKLQMDAGLRDRFLNIRERGLRQAIKFAEKDSLLVWQDHLPEMIEARRKLQQEKLQALAREVPAAGTFAAPPNIRAIYEIRRLQTLGYMPRVDVDSLEQVLLRASAATRMTATRLDSLRARVTLEAVRRSSPRPHGAEN